MLDACGVSTPEELFTHLPEAVRLNRPLNLAPGISEYEIVQYFRDRADNCANGHAIFLGAGVYNHFRPVLVDTVVSRGEFLTSYTPYQAEISQGILTTIFEFQSMICELTGMEVANASMYDGSTATPEAAMMSVRPTGRSNVVIARSVHPEYREVLRTYAQHQGLPITEVGFGENGRLDMAALDKAVTDQTACIMVQSPNFFGTIEDVAALADYAHKKGALLVVSIAEAISLGAMRPPVEADIVAMEAQSFGVPLGFGGPYAGVIATKDKFVRQMPGRLVGQTVDRHGRRGFVLTLSTREQHIKREKATSNICTNQALVALMTTIFMAIYGREGMKELAKQNLAKANYAANEFGKSKTAKVMFSGAPRFNEF